MKYVLLNESPEGSMSRERAVAHATAVRKRCGGNTAVKVTCADEDGDYYVAFWSNRVGRAFIDLLKERSVAHSVPDPRTVCSWSELDTLNRPQDNPAESKPPRRGFLAQFRGPQQ